MANKKITDVDVVSAINDADYLFVNQGQSIKQIKKSDIPKPIYTAEEVGALPNTTIIPTTLPNPNALTFTGAATGSYDGSSPVEINIPEGGGTGVTVDTTLSVAGQAADAKATGDAISSLSATVNDLKGDMENVGQPTDEQIQTAVDNFLEENPVSGVTSGIKLGLPKRYELVEGDTFELFYKGIINAVYPEILFPMVNSIDNGFPSSMLSRKFSYRPAGSEYINRNGKYRVDLYDNNKNLLDSQTTYLLSRPKATNPIEEKVVLYVSDSLANFGNVPDEFYQRVQKDGLTNVKFIGTQKSQDNSVPYEGYGGWTFGSYADTSTSSAEMYITTNHDKTNDDKHGIYEDSNGTQWRLEDIGNNTIKITRYSGTTELPSTGTLTWVSGGVNTSNIVYTESKVGSSNPFCIGGKVDFKAYADSQGVEKIDYIYVLLGWNTFGKNEAYTKQKVMEFCNNVWASFPECRIVLLGLQIPARDGCGLQYGANESGNYQKRIQYVFDINNWYEELAESYSEYLLSFVNIAGQFDSEYNLITEEIEVNARNPLKETIQSDGLHPSTYGHYQIADACYRDLHHKLQEETVSLTQDLTGVVSSTYSDKVIKGKPLEIAFGGGNTDGTGWKVNDSDITVTMNGESQTTENGVFSTDSVTGNIVVEATASEFVPYETAFVELSVPATYKLTPISWTIENPNTCAKVDNDTGYSVIDSNYANREIYITIDETGITVHKEAVNEWIGEFTKFYEGAKKIYLSQGWVSSFGSTVYEISVVSDEEGGDGGEVEPDTPTEATLSSISATYNGGNVLVGTSVNALIGITVTGHYSDGTTKTLTGYTLSGTIAEGNNTITVTYEDKTTTITVIGYVEESDEPVEIGTIYVEEGQFIDNNITINTIPDTSEDGFTTTAIPIKVGDTIDCTFGQTLNEWGDPSNGYTYLNNRITKFNSNGDYVYPQESAFEYPWTSDINGYVRIGYNADKNTALTGITLNGTALEVVNNTESSQPYVEEENDETLTFPFETTKVKLFGNGTYYLTPIAYTNANPTFLVSVSTKDNGYPVTHDTNEARKLHKITIADSGITVYTQKYNEYLSEKTSIYDGATEILFGAGEWGGYDITKEENPCVVTYRVDTDESQWGVGIPVETA